MDTRKFRSIVLVAVQFVTAGLLIYLGTRTMLGTIESLLVVGGGCVGLSGIVTMRLGNFRILPIPKPDAILVTSGIYRWIRHPMYTGLLLAMAGFALNDLGLAAIVLWFVLLFDLIVKLQFEERLLNEVFGDYSQYAAGSKRLIPFLW
jgi:protein-S-isoprenylcysteine O-methyltransferase Ste14